MAVGILSTEAQRAAAVDLEDRLKRKIKGTVRRLTVTVGPNGRGARDLGMLPHLGPGYTSLNGQSGKGRPQWPGANLDALYVHESSPLHAFTPSDAESMWLPSLAFFVYHRFKASALDELAHVIIPGHAFTEKGGTVTNMEGRTQRIKPAIDAAWVRPDWKVFQEIADQLGGTWTYDDVDGITADLMQAVAAYGATMLGERVLWSERK